MTRTWPVLIMSLSALFSPAAVNYAAADCASDNSWCTNNCNGMFQGSGPYATARESCLSNCRNVKYNCDAQNYWEQRRRAEEALAKSPKQKDKQSR